MKRQKVISLLTKKSLFYIPSVMWKRRKRYHMNLIRILMGIPRNHIKLCGKRKEKRKNYAIGSKFAGNSHFFTQPLIGLNYVLCVLETF